MLVFVDFFTQFLFAMRVSCSSVSFSSVLGSSSYERTFPLLATVDQAADFLLSLLYHFFFSSLVFFFASFFFFFCECSFLQVLLGQFYYAMAMCDILLFFLSTRNGDAAV